nr:MBL fold metallo-hydrolase [Microbacterium lemovicicum]
MASEREGVTQVAPGVLRIHRATVNCYLVVTSAGITLVDAGLPGMWRTLGEALASVGATPEDISAVVLTHGHFDHVGLCRRLRLDHGVVSHVHPSDRRLVQHPYRYEHERPRWAYPVRFPRAIPLLVRLTAAGALTVKGTEAQDDVRPGEALDVPSGLVPIFSPGHTDGHCAYLLPERGILLSGDALVTVDPYTGRAGPRMVARAATADVAENVHSLRRLAQTDASLVLPGHGAPFRGGIRRAVEQAWRAGIG